MSAEEIKRFFEETWFDGFDSEQFKRDGAEILAQIDYIVNGDEAEHMRDERWQPIATAPKDGTKVDLKFPHPRGRQIDCMWIDRLGWHWRERTWGGPDGGLLPEKEWRVGTYPHLEPTHWMLSPELPK